ncbi:MAG TPA: prenyltransferase/squalene oxidase repeat-containing protein [Candidatus Obscuribacterales bacterium]
MTDDNSKPGTERKALPITAQARRKMAADAHQRGLTFLKEHLKEGSWAFKPGLKEPSTEATAWCAIALRNDAETAQQVLDFLRRTQNSDGGWSTAPGAGKSDWTASLALLSGRILTHMHQNAPWTAGMQSSLTRCSNYLFDVRTEFYRPVARLILLLIKGEASLHYARGWPWMKGCFHWVEPTSYSLLALNIPHALSAEVFKQAAAYADKFLIENACTGGGWNHGNVRCLGADLPPYVVTTAEALLALQNKKTDPKVAAGFKYLDKTRHENTSAMSLAWTLLARNAHEISQDEEIDRLLKAQNKDGSFGPNLMVTGLALAALDAALGRNALKFGAKGGQA